jgi:hypothetical protein
MIRPKLFNIHVNHKAKFKFARVCIFSVGCYVLGLWYCSRHICKYIMQFLLFICCDYCNPGLDWMKCLVYGPLRYVVQ